MTVAASHKMLEYLSLEVLVAIFNCLPVRSRLALLLASKTIADAAKISLYNIWDITVSCSCRSCREQIRNIHSSGEYKDTISLEELFSLLPRVGERIISLSVDTEIFCDRWNTVLKIFDTLNNQNACPNLTCVSLPLALCALIDGTLFTDDFRRVGILQYARGRNLDKVTIEFRPTRVSTGHVL